MQVRCSIFPRVSQQHDRVATLAARSRTVLSVRVMQNSIVSPRRFSVRAFGVGLVCMGISACGGGESKRGVESPKGGSESTPDSAATFEPTADERAACSPKKPEEVDSLACLGAVRKRKVAGDEKGATSLLEFGCKEGDLDACLDLRLAAIKAGNSKRASELLDRVGTECNKMGDLGKKLAACLRDRTTDSMKKPGFPAELPFDLALALRAQHGPTLISMTDMLSKACADALAGNPPLQLRNTALGKDPLVVDAMFRCGTKAKLDIDGLQNGVKLTEIFQGNTMNGGPWTGGGTLQGAAPAGNVEAGVWCPSQLIDDEMAADVFMKTQNGDTLAMTVHIDKPCLSAEAIAERKARRSRVESTFASNKAVITAALVKLADRCDKGAANFDPKVSPLAGDAIEKTPGVLGFEAICELGYRSLHFKSSKPIKEPSVINWTHFYVRAGGRSLLVTAIKELPKELWLTFYERQAELKISVKMP